MPKLFDYVVAYFIIVVSTVMLAATIMAVRDSRIKNSDDDVMKACEKTGMYLKDGYAISCRVLRDPSIVTGTL